MAGLGLVNALNEYASGVEWKQQQDQQARIEKQRAAIDEANQAAASVLDANSSTMFKAAEARGSVLAKRGLWDQFMQNEASIAPMRLKTRAEALQRYEADGDVEALARSVYPTIFDGKDIIGTERVEGADAVAGLPARAAKLKLKLSDGSTQDMDPQKMVQIVKSSLIDPQTTLKNEILLNMEREKARIHGDKEIRVGEAKGSEDRKTADRRAQNDRGLMDVRFGYQKEIAGMNNASRETVAETRAGATVDAAGMRAARGSGGGGGDAGKVRLQRSDDDADGYKVGYYSDGTSRRFIDKDTGQPVKSGTWAKRVDAMVRTLQNAPGNYRLSPSELRKKAEESVAASVQPAAAPEAKPTATSSSSSPASSTSPASASTGGSDKFTAGKIYKDKNGNRAKYLGNGKWEPA